MNKLKLTIYFLLLIPIMLIDPHISELINTFFTSETHISIFLFFIFNFYLSQQIGYFIAFPLSLILGMIYDYYYFDYLGIMVIAFPVSISFLYIFTKYLEKNSKIQSTLLFSIYLFLVNFICFLIVRSLDFTSLSWTFFITYELLPSLIVNIFLFVTINTYLNRFIY